MMTIIQNAFMNNSSSLLMSKVQGNIVDLLMPPISNFQIIVSFILVGSYSRFNCCNSGCYFYVAICSN
jgi:ABC-2 type transport system permease protein